MKQALILVLATVSTLATAADVKYQCKSHVNQFVIREGIQVEAFIDVASEVTVRGIFELEEQSTVAHSVTASDLKYFCSKDGNEVPCTETHKNYSDLASGFKLEIAFSQNNGLPRTSLELVTLAGKALPIQSIALSQLERPKWKKTEEGIVPFPAPDFTMRGAVQVAGRKDGGLPINHSTYCQLVP